jgi:chromate resistance exported protein
MIVGDEVVVGEAGRQLGQPTLGKMAAHPRDRRGGASVGAPAGAGHRVDQGEGGPVPFAQPWARRMTRERTKKIHRQSRGAPVVPRPVDAPALLAGTSDEEVETMFRTERDTDYAAIERDARALAGRGEPTEDELARLRQRLEETERIDWFDAPGRAAAERALAGASGPHSPSPEAVEASASPVRGATWVTRTGIKVDRISSAWLIRRFIDPAARFKFVPAKGYRPAAGELRFDMFQGEYTHEGDRCTFETLLALFGLTDPALRALG